MSVEHHEITTQVFENLDFIIDYHLFENDCIDLDKLHNDIKSLVIEAIFTTDYIYLYLHEESFKDVTDTFKTVFWSNSLNLWTGRISLANWVSGIGIKTLAEGFKFSNLFTSAVSYGVTSSITDIVTKTTLLRLTFSFIFPTILLGMVLFSIVSGGNALKIKNLERTIRTMLQELHISNDKKLFDNFNKEYERIVKRLSTTITDKKELLKAASEKYMEYISTYILPIIIERQVSKFNDLGFPLKHLATFYDLCDYEFVQPNISNIVKNSKIMYDLYKSCMDVFVFNETNRRKMLLRLDREVVNAVKSIKN